MRANYSDRTCGRRASACLLSVLAFLFFSLRVTSAQEVSLAPDLPFDPPTYVIYRTPGPIVIDGTLDDAAWESAPWTESFVDIRGGDSPVPRFETRAKMLWDDEYLYIAAELEDTDVWATYTERDSPIFRDNAFEVFIDPTGDTHNYYELEVNALGTIWDLMLVRPHRDGGPSISAWDIRGLKVAVQVHGTLNDPRDRDEGWSVEFALPWSVLREAASERRAPRDGEQWRLNFARSQWSLNVVDGAYQKDDDAPADWWVWAAHGAINMHMPERWGIIEFAEGIAGEDTRSVKVRPAERIKWALRQLYYLQREYHDLHRHYAAELSELNVGEVTIQGMNFEPELQVTQSSYEISAPGGDGNSVHIRHDGKVWITPP